MVFFTKLLRSVTSLDENNKKIVIFVAVENQLVTINL